MVGNFKLLEYKQYVSLSCFAIPLTSLIFKDLYPFMAVGLALCQKHVIFLCKVIRISRERGWHWILVKCHQRQKTWICFGLLVLSVARILQQIPCDLGYNNNEFGKQFVYAVTFVNPFIWNFLVALYMNIPCSEVGLPLCFTCNMQVLALGWGSALRSSAADPIPSRPVASTTNGGYEPEGWATRYSACWPIDRRCHNSWQAQQARKACGRKCRWCDRRVRPHMLLLWRFTFFSKLNRYFGA